MRRVHVCTLLLVMAVVLSGCGRSDNGYSAASWEEAMDIYVEAMRQGDVKTVMSCFASKVSYGSDSYWGNTYSLIDMEKRVRARLAQIDHSDLRLEGQVARPSRDGIILTAVAKMGGDFRIVYYGLSPANGVWRIDSMYEWTDWLNIPNWY